MLGCLAPSKDNLKSKATSTKLQLVSLQSFNSVSKTFKAGAELCFYFRLLMRLHNIRVSSMKDLAVLAFVTLFDAGTETGSRLDPETLRVRQLLFDGFIAKPEFGFNLDSLSSTLVTMHSFSRQCASKNATHKSLNVLTVTYSEDEEKWLKGQFGFVEQAFRSLVVDEEMIQEFMLIPYGVHPPKDHAKKIFSIFFERVLRVFQVHPDFAALSGAEKAVCIRGNSPLGLALMIVKAETCPSFIEQLKDGLGELDDDRWKELYLPMAEMHKNFAPTTVTEIGKTAQNVNVKTVAVLTKDSWMFKLSLLMVLTLPQETESSRVMSSLHSRFRMAFERRLRWTRELQLNEAQVPEPDMSTIMPGIKNLSILSGIALKFMGSK